MDGPPMGSVRVSWLEFGRLLREADSIASSRA